MNRRKGKIILNHYDNASLQFHFINQPHDLNTYRNNIEKFSSRNSRVSTFSALFTRLIDLVITFKLSTRSESSGLR